MNFQSTVIVFTAIRESIRRTLNNFMTLLVDTLRARSVKELWF